MVPEGAGAASKPPGPWYERPLAAVRRFWKNPNPRVAAVRDVAVAAGVVFLLLAAIWIYTGQPVSQAPLVVVESGSMMHGPYGPCLDAPRGCSDFDRPGFGRVGTIDPGDLVLVKDVDSLDDVETAFGSGKRSGYDAHGDVLVYKRPPSGDGTPIIHRAMLKVLVQRELCWPGAENSSACVYRIPETCDAQRFAQFVKPATGTSDWRAYCQGSSEPITLDLERDGAFLSLRGYPCDRACGQRLESGILTKGDNNFQMDQSAQYQGARGGTIACCPIRLEDIVGKARGEIPWFGLIKLALYGNQRYQCGVNEPCSDPTQDTQWTFIRATAPWDIWIMLFLAIGALVAAPVAYDFAMGKLRARR